MGARLGRGWDSKVEGGGVREGGAAGWKGAGLGRGGRGGVVSREETGFPEHTRLHVHVLEVVKIIASWPL